MSEILFSNITERTDEKPALVFWSSVIRPELFEMCTRRFYSVLDTVYSKNYDIIWCIVSDSTNNKRTELTAETLKIFNKMSDKIQIFAIDDNSYYTDVQKNYCYGINNNLNSVETAVIHDFDSEYKPLNYNAYYNDYGLTKLMRNFCDTVKNTDNVWGIFLDDDNSVNTGIFSMFNMLISAWNTDKKYSIAVLNRLMCEYGTYSSYISAQKRLDGCFLDELYMCSCCKLNSEKSCDLKKFQNIGDPSSTLINVSFLKDTGFICSCVDKYKSCIFGYDIHWLSLLIKEHLDKTFFIDEHPELWSDVWPTFYTMHNKYCAFHNAWNAIKTLENDDSIITERDDNSFIITNNKAIVLDNSLRQEILRIIKKYYKYKIDWTN